MDKKYAWHEQKLFLASMEDSVLSIISPSIKSISSVYEGFSSDAEQHHQ